MKIIKNKRGESTIGTAVSIIISITLGGLILAGITSLVKTQITPKMQSNYKTQESQSIQNTENKDITYSDVFYSPGDVNKDGTININDVFYLERVLASWPGYPTIDTVDKAVADLDNNNVINDNDLKCLKNMDGTGG